MLEKVAKPELCNVCRIAVTTHTAETETRGGTPVSFPCCLKCRSVIYDLEYEKREMDLEEEIMQNVHKAVKSGVDIQDDHTRHLQNARERQGYKVVSHETRIKGKVRGSKKAAIVDATSLLALLQAKSLI